MDASAKAQIYQSLQEKFEFLYDKLGATDTRQLVEQHVSPARIVKPKPAALEGVDAS